MNVQEYSGIKEDKKLRLNSINRRKATEEKQLWAQISNENLCNE